MYFKKSTAPLNMLPMKVALQTSPIIISYSYVLFSTYLLNHISHSESCLHIKAASVREKSGMYYTCMCT